MRLANLAFATGVAVSPGLAEAVGFGAKVGGAWWLGACSFAFGGGVS